ncbi:DNA-directed RNA polymerase [Neorhizobium galegae]|uniref:DNA-directed RNA polymerase n=1 Tax=Neorhizobium galegae bv. orientalis str. HAMBI 540 TaxID=1028800 RepID=A0A068SMS8_NEOGA|nr:DNA-directed RNA polymerase [Neorhizobium galegae]CDN47538.1 T3/T7-like RNA polymerase [Neorhizobium galegae bv. orientalis str. HAMBI 540]
MTSHDLTNELFLAAHGCLPTEHPGWEKQIALEDEMRSAGIARFEKALEKNQTRGNESSNLSSRRMIIHAHEMVVAGIKAFLEEASSGKAGKKHTAVAYLRDADLDVVAHLALRNLFDCVSTRTKITPLSIRIASMIEDEMFFNAFRDQDKDAYEFARKKIGEQTHNAVHQKRAMTKHAKHKGAEWQDWSVEGKTAVGLKLIEIVVEATGLFETVRQSEGVNNTNIYVVATKDTMEWLATENSRLAPLSPVYLPTLLPPRPWTSPFRGGYWSGRVRNLRLIKTGNRQYLTDLDSIDMPKVYHSVNAMQNTAWTINRRVYDVMTSLWDNRSTLACLPQADDIALPEKPMWLTPEMKREDMTVEQVDQFMRWKSERTAIYEANARAVSKRLAFSRMLWVAERFKDEEEFFFPHQMDFRGRVYAVPLFLNPQGDDAAHGLLQFANSVPIGDEEGANWLAIHGAGLWGVDKCSMEERVQWVKDNEEGILASASDPYDNRFWLTAEKPWQALAFCHEWDGYRAEGYSYESHLPVQMDGTCNGLQNFSAMLLDEIGGAAVNLVPGDKPNDIYATVAEVLIKKLQEISEACPEDTTTKEVLDKETKEPKTIIVESDGSMARKWLAYGITRKVTKRPVMTLAYGASEFGFREQVFTDTVTPWKQSAGEAFPFEGTGFSAASFLGLLIWDCVGEVVVAARGAMDWLQEVAKIAAKEGLPVIWNTPTGLKVMQEYTSSEQKRIALTFQKVRMRLSLDVATKKIDKRKQGSGISPNWVHSMDAAHMQLTVSRCHDEGIRSFSLIHDSYGTHAGNAWAMAQFLREEFVRMYGDHDVLQSFKEEIAMMLGVDHEALPTLPKKGSLDLSQVLESPFFFA